MAIVNEDPAMVKFLLDCGADAHQRCCGNFFTPFDQQSSRRENDQHEWFDVTPETNYKGLTTLTIHCSHGGVIMTTESNKKDVAIKLSHINISGRVGHVTS